MALRLRTFQAAAVRLYVWSPTHEPHELAYATNLRIQVQISQTPQYDISDEGDPYEVIENNVGTVLQLSWLVVPKERLWALGYIDPRDVENSAGDVLLRKLFGHDGINILGEDKITGERLFRATDVKLQSLSLSVARSAIVARDAVFSVRQMPLFKSGLFTEAPTPSTGGGGGGVQLTPGSGV